MGKTTLFITCIFTSLLLIGSAFYIYGLVELDVYSESEAELYHQMAEYPINHDSYSVIESYYYESDQKVVNDKGNMIFAIYDKNGACVQKSTSASEDDDWTFGGIYGLEHVGINQISGITEDDVDYFNVRSRLAEPLVENDKYQLISTLTHIAYSLRYSIYLLVLIIGLLDLYSFIGLLNVVGYNNSDDNLHEGYLSMIPFDLLCGIYLALFILDLSILDNSGVKMFVVTFLVSLVAFGSGLLGLILTMTSRIKTKTLIKNTITYRLILLAIALLKWLLKLIKKILVIIRELIISIPIVWKAVAFVGGMLILDMIFLYNEGYVFFKALILIPLTIIVALGLRKLRNGARQLAGGDLSSHVDTKGLFLDLKQHGDDLNQLSKGMAIALEEQLKSERMKTELITNVSHDIKTPLTSIINYASLISEESTDNEKIKEYSEVLVRQSGKLKRLIEDLVEASKASTGNLEVNLAICDANIFLLQASGEYEEKLKQNQLTLISKQADKEMLIMADGRRMWRIFDNLMNNICKYAQPNTRVYLSIEQVDSSVVITFKNTSKDQLDMSEQELMERFTRGDHSRNTEGNGLGLSIAKSLAELQNGSLSLSIDGDLFKAILKFPMIQ